MRDDDKPQVDLRGHKIFDAHAAALRRGKSAPIDIAADAEAANAMDTRLHTTDRAAIGSVLSLIMEQGNILTDDKSKGALMRVEGDPIIQFGATSEGQSSLAKANNGLKSRLGFRQVGEYPRWTITGCTVKAAEFLRLCDEYGVKIPDKKKQEIDAAIAAAPGPKPRGPEPLDKSKFPGPLVGR